MSGRMGMASGFLGRKAKGLSCSGGLRGLRDTMMPLARRNWSEEGQSGFLPMLTPMMALSVDLSGTLLLLAMRVRCWIEWVT